MTTTLLTLSLPTGPVRVLLAADVIALPDEGWAMGGFGERISEEWLMTQARPRIPGAAARRRDLVKAVRAAMDSRAAKGKGEGR
jgi:hypothetical protein